MTINEDILGSILDKKRKYIFKENSNKKENDNSTKLLEENNLKKQKKMIKLYRTEEPNNLYPSTRYDKIKKTNNTNINKNKKGSISSKSVDKFNNLALLSKLNLKSLQDFNLPLIATKKLNKEIFPYLKDKYNSPDPVEDFSLQNENDNSPSVDDTQNIPKTADENKIYNLFNLNINKINIKNNFISNKNISGNFLQKKIAKINKVNEVDSVFVKKDLLDEEKSPLALKKIDSSENNNYKQIIEKNNLKIEKNTKFHRNSRHELTQNLPNNNFINQLQPLSSTNKNFEQKKRKTTSLDEYRIKTKIDNNCITFGAESQAGLINTEKNITKINQDSFLIKESIFDENYHLFGIFDGHGTHGHHISKFSAEFIRDFFTNKIYFDDIFEKIDQKRLENKNKNENKNEDIKEDKINNKIENENNSQKEKSYSSRLFKLFIRKKQNLIKKSIFKLEKELYNKNFNIAFSGSTLLTLFILDDFLVCCCVGDSKCLLFKESINEQWSYVILSTEHKPNIESEKNRIENKGGEIHPFYNEKSEPEGDNRVWTKGKQYPGLSLTRAIGDTVGKKIGIISEPDFIIKRIDNRSKFIILGSDGLWDMLKPIDIIKIVKPFYKKNDPQGAANELIKKASQLWAKNTNERDDITVIVIFIR